MKRIDSLLAKLHKEGEISSDEMFAIAASIDALRQTQIGEIQDTYGDCTVRGLFLLSESTNLSIQETKCF